jgi:hypothetical protein
MRRLTDRFIRIPIVGDPVVGMALIALALTLYAAASRPDPDPVHDAGHCRACRQIEAMEDR